MLEATSTGLLGSERVRLRVLKAQPGAISRSLGSVERVLVAMRMAEMPSITEW